MHFATITISIALVVATSGFAIPLPKTTPEAPTPPAPKNAQDVVNNWKNSTDHLSNYIENATNSAVLSNQKAFKDITKNAIRIISAQKSYNEQLSSIHIDKKAQQNIKCALADIETRMQNIAAVEPTSFANFERYVLNQVAPLVDIACGALSGNISEFWNAVGVDTKPTQASVCPSGCED